MHCAAAIPMDLLEREFPQTVVVLPNGTQVSVRQHGAPGRGPSVVLLHGISSGAASWLHVALALERSVHVLAWDAPGYGDSTPLASSAPMAQHYAAQLHGLLQKLEIQRCILVGHSLGALMAAAYARDLGADIVARLLLVSPAGGYGAPDQADAREKVRSQRQEALQTLGVSGIAQRIDQRLLSPAAKEEVRQWIRWNTARLHPAGYLQAVELLCQSDLGAGMHLTMPVEVWCGDADVVTTPEASAAWAQKLSASFHTIPNAGHASPSEQAAAVARLIACPAQP